MKRVMAVALMAAGMAFCGQAARATTFAVGTCRPTWPSFPTISAAVAGVPPGSIIEVCPGVYPEQVTISIPLTLIGGTDGNAGRVVIVAPANGVVINAGSTYFGLPVAAQVLITTGPVKIEGITVDGAGISLPPLNQGCLFGIYYDGSGASGVVDAVTTRNQVSNGCSVGIAAENGNQPVTIADSSVHEFDYDGIQGYHSTETVSDNAISGPGSNTPGPLGGIGSYGTPKVMNNVVSDVGQGVGAACDSPATCGTAKIVGNTVVSSQTGLYPQILVPPVVELNLVWNTSTGILAYTQGKIQGNRFLDVAVGLEFDCTAGVTASGNFINDAGIGLDMVPPSYTPLFNSIKNADTIRTGGCP